MDIKNLLLINYYIGRDENIEKFLSSEHHKLVTVNEKEIFDETFEISDVDLILCRHRIDNLANYDIIELIKRINIDNKITVVFISPLNNPEFYFKELESNILYHIITPCSNDYLKTSLEKIINNLDKVEEKNTLHHLQLKYKANEYNINISTDKLENHLVSVVENAVHQNKILKNIVYNNMKISNVSKYSDTLDDKYISLTDSDFDMDSLQGAIDKNELRLFYQPVISVKENTIYGFEALIRWEKNNVIIPPDEFIVHIENSPLIARIGHWIAYEASRQLKIWQEEFDFKRILKININLSPKQFGDPELCEKIFKIINKNGILPDNIGIEITESVIMEDMEAANNILLQFKSRGFHLYMDDFGTGYSSLSYLLHFPFNVMKIDKSFVQWMHFDRESEEIVRSIVALAHNLNKIVVAEGVELEEHLDILKEIKCDYWQGYLRSKPLDSISARKMLLEFL